MRPSLYTVVRVLLALLSVLGGAACEPDGQAAMQGRGSVAQSATPAFADESSGDESNLPLGKTTPDSTSESNVMPDWTTAEQLAEYVSRFDGSSNDESTLRRLAELGAAAVGETSRVEGYLEAPEPRTRMQAIVTLSAIAQHAGAEYAERFSELVDGRDELVARAAVRALGSMGPRAQTAVPVLRRLLLEDNHELQQDVINAMRKIDPDALLDSIPSLHDLLYRGGNTMRRTAGGYSLALIGAVRLPPTEDELKQAELADQPPFERMRTGIILEVLSPVTPEPEIPGPPPSLDMLDPRLRQVPDQLYEVVLSNAPQEVRLQCIYTISTYGHFAAYKVRSLMPLLDSKDSSIAQAAGECIAWVSPAGSLQREDYRKLLAMENVAVSSQVCDKLLGQKDMARSLLPEITGVLEFCQQRDFGSSDLDLQAATLLAGLEPLPKESQAALAKFVLLNCTRDDLLSRERNLEPFARYAGPVWPQLEEQIDRIADSTMGYFGLQRLASLDPEGKHVGRALLRQARAAEAMDRGQALTAIGALKQCPPEARDYLIDTMLHDEDEMVRTMACSALAASAGKSREAALALAEYAALCSGYELFNAAGCALQVAEANPALAGEMLSAIEQGGPRARPMYELAAARLTRDDAEATKHLLPALKDSSNSWLQAFAIEEAGIRGAAAKACVPELLALANGPQHDLRWLALCALGRVDAAAAAPFIEQLRDQLFSGSEKSRQQSAWLLGQIGPAAAAAVPDLRHLLYETSPDLRMAAALAIKRIDAGA